MVVSFVCFASVLPNNEQHRFLHHDSLRVGRTSLGEGAGHGLAGRVWVSCSAYSFCHHAPPTPAPIVFPESEVLPFYCIPGILTSLFDYRSSHMQYISITVIFFKMANFSPLGSS